MVLLCCAGVVVVVLCVVVVCVVVILPGYVSVACIVMHGVYMSAGSLDTEMF